jgi:hypothetical protein
MHTDRLTIQPIVLLFVLFVAIGCDIPFEDTTSEEADPPYQNLDGGQDWPEDTEGNGTDDGEGFDAPVLDSNLDAGTDTTEGDAGDCIDIGWDSYQVVGNCPDLPSSGEVDQGDDCSITIPGDLGAVIGDNGEVEGAYVNTDHCTGIAEVTDFPSVELTCIVEEASCEVDLSGGTSGW